MYNYDVHHDILYYALFSSNSELPTIFIWVYYIIKGENVDITLLKQFQNQADYFFL